MKDAEDDLIKGWNYFINGDFISALETYTLFLNKNKNNAQGYNCLGLLYHEIKELELAIESFKHSIEIEPFYPSAYNNLGNTLIQMGNIREALEAFDNAIDREPECIDFHKNKANAFYWGGDFDSALKYYNKILLKYPKDSEAHTFSGIIHLLHGRYEKGFEEYKWRWKLPYIKSREYHSSLWDGSSLENKTLLLIPEQGMGDTILFLRTADIIKKLYDCRIILSCSKKLSGLINSCKLIDEIIDDMNEIPHYDYYIPMQDIPLILGMDKMAGKEMIPYLKAETEIFEKWRSFFKNYENYKIGVVWQGNPDYYGDFLRSFPLSSLEPFCHLKNIHLFSLQKGYGEEQLDSMGIKMGIINLGDKLDTKDNAFIDTAGVLKNIDMLICPETAIAHIAGALGIRVCLVLSSVPAWYWGLGSDKTDLYPNTVIYRRKNKEDWKTFFRGIAKKLIRDNFE